MIQYLRICLQLLGWAFFKPYTLDQYVKDIHPELGRNDNPFNKRDEFEDNPRLKRYAGQVWWLAALMPVVVVLLIAPLYNLYWFYVEEMIAGFIPGYSPVAASFNWLVSGLFFIGWFLGLLLACAKNRTFAKWTVRVLWTGIIIATIFLIGREYRPELFSLSTNKNTIIFFVFLRLFFLLAVCMLAGAKFGIGHGVVFDVSIGVGFGLACGVLSSNVAVIAMLVSFLSGVALGVAVGPIINVMIGTATGVALLVAMAILPGVVFGVIFGVTDGVSVTMAIIFVSVPPFIIGLLRIYSWFPELLWMLFLKNSSRCATYKIHRLPPYADQLINLPLPFMAKVIAEAYLENQETAWQAIDYFITSTNQQRVAGQAISVIGTGVLSRCQTTQEISAISKQLNTVLKPISSPFVNENSKTDYLKKWFWIPGVNISEFFTHLPHYLAISQDVAAALKASSMYRQSQQLGNVCQRISKLRNSLVSASTEQATTYGGILDQWLRILETAQRTLKEQANHSNEIPQVYLPGAALDPNKANTLFKGRHDLFRQIETLTLSAQHPTLSIYGGRRTGKTSTLNYLPRWMPSHILPLLVDGQQLAVATTLSGFAEEFADQIIKSAHLIHNVQLPAPDKDSLARDPFVALRRWMDTVEQVTNDKTLLICLDEFERMDEIVTCTNSRTPLNFLRHIIQHREQWTLLFSGAHTLEELPAYWNDYLINCHALRISYLAKDDTFTLIQKPVEDFPDIYPSGVVEAIWNLTAGQPYFTQLLCYELVEYLNKRKQKTAELEDIAAVTPAVFERGHQVFHEFWGALTEAQRQLLLALAEGEPITVDQSAAATLVRKETLALENGAYHFRVPLIQQWILATYGHNYVP